MERMGQDVLSIQPLTHGYQDRTLSKNCDFEMEKAERVVLIGEPYLCCKAPHTHHGNLVTQPLQGNVCCSCGTQSCLGLVHVCCVKSDTLDNGN
jgi:hypothetical protein